MSQPELLKKVALALQSLRVEFMVSGSFASSMQGEPRSTHDIDLVVALPASGVDGLIRAFPSPGFYLPDRDQILAAIRDKSMFNLIDAEEGDKVDFWMLTSQAFDQSRFSRRVHEEVLGMTIPITSPEDTIVMKLQWAKQAGGSEKQFRDALRVYEVQFRKLDIPYVEHWVSRLGIGELWAQLLSEARPET
jgi:hypothetical protein